MNGDGGVGQENERFMTVTSLLVFSVFLSFPLPEVVSTVFFTTRLIPQLGKQH